MIYRNQLFALLLVLLSFISGAQAETLKPFILGNTPQGNLDEVVEATPRIPTQR